MSIHGDYAALIVHSQRSRELQAEVQKESLARRALSAARRKADRKARAVAGSRARTV